MPIVHADSPAGCPYRWGATAGRAVASRLRLDGLGHIHPEISHSSQISSVWKMDTDGASPINA